MPLSQETSREAFRQWPGRISNADPHDLPPGGAVVQDNCESLEPGTLSPRKGIQLSSEFTPSSPGTDDAFSLYGYERPEGDFAVVVDTAGNITTRRASAKSSITTSVSTFYPWAFARTRRGELIGVNGLDRGIFFDGFTEHELGIDAPTAAPTITMVGSGNATAGDYVCAYRFVDDSLPTPRYSSISPSTTETATAGQQHEWTGISSSSQSRVVKVQFWRTTSAESNLLYLIAEIGHNGTITSSDNNGGSVRFTLPSGHNLIVGSVIVVAGHSVGGYNTTHEVTAVTATTVTTDQSYSADGTGGTWTLSGFKGDTLSDTALISAAASDVTKRLNILQPDGAVYARRHTPPPNHKAAVAMLQDRWFYAADVFYDDGTVTTNGTTTLTGVGTAWTEEMVGRQVYIRGESQIHTVASYSSATSLTLSESASTSTSGLSYGIAPDQDEVNRIYYSEQDLPESVPDTNVLTLQQKHRDPDRIVGLMPFGSVLYVLQERHISTLTFYQQPKLDADTRLLADRGACNHHCWDIDESIAFIMDEQGCYRMTPGGQVTPISDEIHDIFRDGTIDWTKKKWFHVVVDPVYHLAYFFVVYSADSSTRPKRALVYNIRLGTWNTAAFQDEIGGSAHLAINGQTRVLLAGENDRIFVLNEGETDLVSSQTRNSPTSATSTTLADTSQSWTTNEFAGAPVAIVEGTGRGQIRKITSNTSDTLTVPAWTTTPDITSVYLIGAIEYTYRSGLMAMEEGDQAQRAFRLTFDPTTGENKVDLRLYLNHNSSAESWDGPRDADSNVSIDGSSDAVVNLKTDWKSGETQGGFAVAAFSARVHERFDGERWAAAELHGFKGDDSINIYELMISGAE